MKTVVNSKTGEVLYCFFDECKISENEIIIDLPATGNFYNFEKKEFYEIIIEKNNENR
jgi:hypothetical protein